MVTHASHTLRILGAAAVAALAGSARAQIAAGDPFPPIAVSGVVAASAIPQIKGHVAVVDFWASWCAPCKASFPAYSRLQKAYLDRGLIVVGVSIDKDEGAYASFLAKLKPDFATVRDSQFTLVGTVQVPTMPTSYLVDRTGTVRFVHAGFRGEQTERELRGEIETLLGEKPPAP